VLHQKKQDRTPRKAAFASAAYGTAEAVAFQQDGFFSSL